MGKNFVADTPFERLQHYPRYLKAIAVRLDKLKANPARDAQLMAEYGRCGPTTSGAPCSWPSWALVDPQIEQFRWLLEELRVGLLRAGTADAGAGVRSSVCKNNGKESEWVMSCWRWRAPSPACAAAGLALRAGPALFSLLLSDRAGGLGRSAPSSADADLPADDAADCGWGLAWLATLPGLPRRLDGDFRRRLPDRLAARRHRHHAADAQTPGQTEYRDVAAMGKDSFVAAAVNSVLASILFVIGWLLTCRCG
jgi:hypothetical protein